jgi:transcriptional regulator with XRE-family HTH domain
MESEPGIGARIGAIRKLRGLTQAALARRIGRSAEAVSSIERGKHQPSFDILQRLAGALGVPMHDFLPPDDDSGDAESPRHAALCRELLDSARIRTLPELEMTARIVAMVARRHADDR